MLRDAGFAIREAPFAYSAAVGRWATPAAGVLAAVVVAGGAWLAGRAGRPGAAVALLGGAALALAVAGRWAAREGVLAMPVARARSVNLVATRGAEPPAVWLVAHLDSKSQPVPIAARAAGITLAATVWLAALALAAAQWVGAASPGGSAWALLAALGALGAAPVAASVVGARSAGALDNASGVAAVLLAAESAPAGAPLGVLLTSAEELGLAGARAWAGEWRASGRTPGIAVNCDGVDDAGRLTAMYDGTRPEALARAVCDCGDVVVRRLLPGILVDAVALGDAGWRTITVSRGTVGTLARIHTPRDTVDRLAGTGIAEAARLMRAVVVRIGEGGAA